MSKWAQAAGQIQPCQVKHASCAPADGYSLLVLSMQLVIVAHGSIDAHHDLYLSC